MMRSHVFPCLLALAGGLGCDRAPPPSAPAPSATGGGAEDAPARPRPLTPEDLEGILPPRWGIGDTWMIRANTEVRDMWRGDIRRTYHYRFRVVDVPRSGADRYLLRAVGGDRHSQEDVLIYVRIPDFAMSAGYAPEDELRYHPASEPHPEVSGRSPVYAFPVMPPFLPSNPPRFVNPVSTGDEEHENLTKQAIFPTPEGLRIRFVRTQSFAVIEIDMLWRRGDPWWSSVRVTARDRDEDAGLGPPGPVLLDFADLYRPGEELAPIPVWWPSDEPMPDPFDPRYGNGRTPLLGPDAGGAPTRTPR